MAQVLPSAYDSFSRGRRDAIEFQNAVTQQKQTARLNPIAVQQAQNNRDLTGGYVQQMDLNNDFTGRTLDNRVGAVNTTYSAQQAQAENDRRIEQLRRMYGNNLGSSSPPGTAVLNELGGLAGTDPRYGYGQSIQQGLGVDASGMRKYGQGTGAGTPAPNMGDTRTPPADANTGPNNPGYLSGAATAYQNQAGQYPAADTMPAPANLYGVPDTGMPDPARLSVAPQGNLPKEIQDRLYGLSGSAKTAPQGYVPILGEQTPNAPLGSQLAPNAWERYNAAVNRYTPDESGAALAGRMLAAGSAVAQEPFEAGYNIAGNIANNLGVFANDADSYISNKLADFYGGVGIPNGLDPNRTGEPAPYQIPPAAVAPAAPADTTGQVTETMMRNMLATGISPERIAYLLETDKIGNLPPGTSLAILGTESNYNPNTPDSNQGAQGIAQMMPNTVYLLNKKYGTNLNPKNVDEALQLQRLLIQDQIGNRNKDNSVFEEATQLYHGGPNRNKWGEMNNLYPQLVLGRLNAYAGTGAQ